jgi:hypothetical protein
MRQERRLEAALTVFRVLVCFTPAYRRMSMVKNSKAMNERSCKLRGTDRSYGTLLDCGRAAPLPPGINPFAVNNNNNNNNDRGTSVCRAKGTNKQRTCVPKRVAVAQTGHTLPLWRRPHSTRHDTEVRLVQYVYPDRIITAWHISSSPSPRCDIFIFSLSQIQRSFSQTLTWLIQNVLNMILPLST